MKSKDIFLQRYGAHITTLSSYLRILIMISMRKNCTCAYYKEMGKPCKHIAAALFELNRVAENQAIKYKNSYRAVNAIFNRMDSEKSLFEGQKNRYIYTLHFMSLKIVLPLMCI